MVSIIPGVIKILKLFFFCKVYSYSKKACIPFVLLFSIGCTSELTELQFDYNAFPDLYNVDGKFICVFYNGWEHGSFPEKDKLMSSGGSIYLAVSDDNGLTWSEPRQIIDTPLDDRDPSLAFIDGRLICSFFQIKARRSKLEYNTMYSESFDEGVSWSAPKTIAENLATTSPFLISNDQKKFILSGYRHNEKLHAECYVVESADNGNYWSAPRMVLKDNVVSLSEPSIVNYKDRLILIARADDELQNMKSIESFDNGENWINVKDLGFPGQSPFLLNIGDSILMLAQRNPLTCVRVSKGDNIQFSKPYIVDNEPGAYGAYPSITHVEGGKFLISYYVETVETQRAEIRFKYLTIENNELEISGVISKIFMAPIRMKM